VNLSVTSRPEMSSTHFFEAVLRGMPRTPVGGERLGKHGALSDGPSAGALRPFCSPLWSTMQRAAALERWTKSGAFEERGSRRRIPFVLIDSISAT